MTGQPSPTSAEVKACCAAAYSGDAVALVLGESYHPGVLALTRRLATALGLRPGGRFCWTARTPGGMLLSSGEAALSQGEGWACRQGQGEDRP